MKNLLIVAMLTLFSGVALGQEHMDIVPPPPPESDQTDDTPFMVVEVMPSLPGCAEITDSAQRDECTSTKIIAHISQNARYPAIAKSQNITGMVFVNFIVGRKGEVEDVQVIRSVEASLDQEAVRVVSGLPTFIPGQHQGQNVRVKYTIPVRFSMPQPQTKPDEK